MQPEDIQKLRSLTTFEALVDYLRDDLDWPIEAEDVDELTFDYDPEELGLNPQYKVKIESLKQLRPLVDDQPWGIFYIQFESKRLPVGVLRRILKALVPKSRQQDPNRPVWRMSDLMFISSQGDPDHRSISFAHFRQKPSQLPELRTFSWDSRESHFYYIKNLNLNALKWPADEVDTTTWRKQWSEAFRVPHRYVPRTSKSLAEEMAKCARMIRETVLDIYEVEHSGGPLHQLHLSFRMTLINDLTPDDFADMYAQTVTYGLFSARATRSGDFAIEDVAAMIPNTNPFLRELLEQLTTQGTVDLDELGVGQLVTLLMAVDIEVILQDFGRQRRGEDPVIHFYETFLSDYDAEKKAKRGVFYTPDAVVSFIVRSVDHILRTEFDCPDGLADTGTMEWKGIAVPKVQILDPATGTGTFLQYVIQVIWDTFYQKTRKISAAKRKEDWNQYVSEHLLPRLHGFELMMAPYTIAHMKLGLKLKETGYDFGSDERLRVYLTNALQPAHEVPRTETPALAHEVEQANEVKTKVPVTVVIGNPPYSVKSYNAGDWIVGILEDYKKTIRQEETQIQAVSNDYVKFLRFGHWEIDKTGKGVLGFITNNGYLSGPLFRDLRNQLLKDFTIVYILNLHGSTRWKELSPDGDPDQNVFDIQQGVAILLLVKNSGDTWNENQVFYADLWGSKESKYNELITNSVSGINWTELSPSYPMYMFVPRDKAGEDEYKKYHSLIDIFGTGRPQKDKHVSYGAGFATQQDEFAISFSAENVDEKIRILTDKRLSEKQVRERFRLCTTNQWNFEKARSNLSTNTWKEKLTQVLYRPFDFRTTAYVQDVVSIPRWAIMNNFLEGKTNFAMIAARIVNGEIPQHEFVSRYPVEKIFLSAKTSNNAFVFPLYLYLDKNTPKLFDDQHRRANLSWNFINAISSITGFKFVEDGLGDLSTTIGPEDIFHYMYAIFHSPIYRERYAEFLKRDFPRLPLTNNVNLFRSLCGLGSNLVALHLMEDDYKAASWVQESKLSPLQSPITTFVEGINGSTMGAYSKSKVYDKGRVYLDTSLKKGSSYFDGIPEDVWNFHIGGYQVLYKWLYDRRGKRGQPGLTLTPEDIEHYQKIVVALKETMRLMEEIDEVIEEHGGWPYAFLDEKKENPQNFEVTQEPSEELKTNSKIVEQNPTNPTTSDYRLYRCGTCGKLVVGFDQENHASDVHKGKKVDWEKLGT